MAKMPLHDTLCALRKDAKSMWNLVVYRRDRALDARYVDACTAEIALDARYVDACTAEIALLDRIVDQIDQFFNK